MENKFKFWTVFQALGSCNRVPCLSFHNSVFLVLFHFIHEMGPVQVIILSVTPYSNFGGLFGLFSTRTMVLKNLIKNTFMA